MRITIRGKSYRWHPEKMHGALLIGGCLTAAIGAAAALWMMMTAMCVFLG